MDRIMTFRAAWRELAPTATFAGMDLAEFEEASGLPLSLRADIATLELQLDGKKSAKADADMAATDLLDLVVNSVRGTPGFGPVRSDTSGKASGKAASRARVPHPPWMRTLPDPDLRKLNQATPHRGL